MTRALGNDLGNAGPLDDLHDVHPVHEGIDVGSGHERIHIDPLQQFVHIDSIEQMVHVHPVEEGVDIDVVENQIGIYKVKHPIGGGDGSPTDDSLAVWLLRLAHIRNLTRHCTVARRSHQTRVLPERTGRVSGRLRTPAPAPLLERRILHQDIE